MTRAPQYSAHTRQQFLGAKRFRQVIVGTGVETRDAVGLRGARGQKDNGNGAAPPDLLQQFEAVEHRQHHIQNHQVVLAVQGPRQAARAIVHGFDGEFVLREEVGHQRTKIRVVVHQQHSSHYFRCNSESGRHIGRAFYKT